ncbi:MAG TPA: tetratricopeptide repeat protein [bacterium]|jgi:tetratricopeptide (TPR) repeat protein
MGLRILAGMLTTLVLAASAAAAVPTLDTSQMYTQEEFAVAIRPYTEAIARNPNDADAHYWLGIAYLHAFRLYRFGIAPYARDFAPRAIAALERALQLRPGMLGALLGLLDLYSMTGDQVKWAATFDRLIALTPPLPLK